MKRSTEKKFAAKRAARAVRARPSGQSRYARKAKWCARNAKWGWEVSTPKPW